MDKKKLIIIVIVVAAVIGYFIYKNNKKSTAPVTGSAGTPVTSNDPGSSLPSPVSMANPVSQQGTGLITPVVIPSSPATFAAGTTDAQTQGSGSSSDPLGGMPSGFVQWANSLGPQNKSRVLTLIPQFTSDEINLINTLVTQNKWGDVTLAPMWNTFIKKYSLPVLRSFSNFQSR